MHNLTFLIFFTILLHCTPTYSQYTVLDEEEKKEILAARQQAIEEAKAALPYEGYVEPVTQRQVYSEDYNPELDAKIRAKQEKLLAEEEARLAEEAAKQQALTVEKAITEQQAISEETANSDTTENIKKPLYDKGTQVRKTIAQRRAERRAAKEGRVFR